VGLAVCNTGKVGHTERRGTRGVKGKLRDDCQLVEILEAVLEPNAKKLACQGGVTLGKNTRLGQTLNFPVPYGNVLEPST
jgi:hypothetical protein